MSPATTRLPQAPDALVKVPTAGAWHPFAREGADFVGVEGRGSGVQLRMHPWFGVSLVRSSGVVTVESRRDVVAQRNWIVLIPPFQLHRLRRLDEAGEGAVTLLLGDVHFKGLALPAQAALVTDPALGKEVATFIAQLQRPVQSVEPATTIRPLLEQLLACSMPLTAGRVRRTSPLAPVRTFLHAHLSEPVPTVELARMIGLTECHLIRAFHYEFGLPPHAYHLRLRLAVACERLARGLAVASVAYECGFADQSHLSRKLKAVYGLTPAAWAASVTGLDRQPDAHMEFTAAGGPDGPASRFKQFRSRPKGGDFKDFECRVRGRRHL